MGRIFSYQVMQTLVKATPWVAAKNDPTSFLTIPFLLLIVFHLKMLTKSNVVLTTVTKQTGILPNSDLNKNNFSLKLNPNLQSYQLALLLIF
jgi:hypothetical protein